MPKIKSKENDQSRWECERLESDFFPSHIHSQIILDEKKLMSKELPSRKVSYRLTASADSNTGYRVFHCDWQEAGT